MKILRLTTALDFGGVEKVYEVFGKNYQGNHEYIFMALGHLGHIGQVLKELGFKVYSLDVDRPSVYNPKVALRLYEWLKKHPVDILHGASAEANFHGALVGRLAGVRRVIVEEIGIPSHSFWGKLMFRVAYKRVDDFLWISTAVRDRIVELKEVKPGRGTLIYNPVGMPDVVREARPMGYSGFLKLASVGRLAKVKNFPLLIELTSKLNLMGIATKLTIIGEGPERTRLESIVEKYDMSNYVSLPGFLSAPNEDIKDSDIYIQPSFSEGFGISVAEAMMVGLPVIGSKVGGLQDIIDDGQTGWFMDPHAPVDDLVDLVKKLMAKEQNELLQICQNGQSSAMRLFSPVKYIAKIEEFYKTVHDK